MLRALAKRPDGMVMPVGPGDGMLEYTDPAVSALATVGAATLTSDQLQSGLIYRTGSTAGFTDTFPTATLLDGGLGGQMSPGDCFSINYSNQVAFIATIAGASGVTLTSTKTTIPASSMGQLILKKLTNAIISTGYDGNGRPTNTITTPGTYALYVL